MAKGEIAYGFERYGIKIEGISDRLSASMVCINLFQRRSIFGREMGGNTQLPSGLSLEGGCRGEEIPGWHTVITGRKREMMAKMMCGKVKVRCG